MTPAEWQRQRRIEDRQLGRCTRCHTRPAQQGLSRCWECRPSPFTIQPVTEFRMTECECGNLRATHQLACDECRRIEASRLSASALTTRVLATLNRFGEWVSSSDLYDAMDASPGSDEQWQGRISQALRQLTKIGQVEKRIEHGRYVYQAVEGAAKPAKARRAA